MEEIKITIIGAGVVGLGIASELSNRYDDIIVLERHSFFGQEISSRNSEVIHAGIYYPQGSLKAKLCVEGAERLYEICEKYSIPHKKIGKLVVAREDEEVKVLEDLFEKGRKNNVKDLRFLSKSDVQKIEPSVNAVAALYSPNTGIIDSYSLMRHFYNIAQANGVLFAFNSEVNFLNKEGNWFVVGVNQEDYRFKSKVVINCAGLSADYIAGLAGIDVQKCGYKLKFCKGSYFSYAKPSPIKMLVYPVPQEELIGLGVHATLDLGNRLRFGPDVEYINSIDYNVDIKKMDRFFESASRLISGLNKESFGPDMAGIRPKLQWPGEKVRDFVIKEESDKGLPGLFNLIGIESPGLTASPAIARMVSEMVDKLKCKHVNTKSI
jgi:L-2-hydroxyglutarate oxidase LhgO